MKRAVLITAMFLGAGAAVAAPAGGGAARGGAPAAGRALESRH